MSPAADALKLKIAEAVDGLALTAVGLRASPEALASAKRDVTNGGGA